MVVLKSERIRGLKDLSRGGPESRADSCADACVCEFVRGYVCAYVRVRALLSSVSKGSHF